MPLCFLVLVLLLFLGLAATTVEEYPFEKFPKNVVALHMPCEESNMFATKCMCHIKCTDKLCNNARNLCDKYSERSGTVSLVTGPHANALLYDSKGCKYMLIRGVGTKKIATLKRTPSAQELSR